jgi:hypothetical protein
MSASENQVLPEGVQRVHVALKAAGHPHAPIMLDGAARTAQEAADTLGVQVQVSPDASAQATDVGRAWVQDAP